MKNQTNDNYATPRDTLRDDEAGARKLEEMARLDPSITAMVIHVATVYMAEKTQSG